MCKVFYLKFWKVKTYDHLNMCPSHCKEERQVWTHAELCFHVQNSVGTLKVKLGFKIQTLGTLAQPFNIKNPLMYKNVKEWQWQHMKPCDWQSPCVHSMVHMHPPTHPQVWKHKVMQTSATKRANMCVLRISANHRPGSIPTFCNKHSIFPGPARPASYSRWTSTNKPSRNSTAYLNLG